MSKYLPEGWTQNKIDDALEFQRKSPNPTNPKQENVNMKNLSPKDQKEFLAAVKDLVDFVRDLDDRNRITFIPDCLIDIEETLKQIKGE